MIYDLSETNSWRLQSAYPKYIYIIQRKGSIVIKKRRILISALL